MRDDFEALVRRNAALSHLEVSSGEVAALGRDFERILDAFRSLAESAEDPAGGAVDSLDPEPRLRADVPAPFGDPDRLLRAAPEPEVSPAGTFFGVPKTVGDEA